MWCAYSRRSALVAVLMAGLTTVAGSAGAPSTKAASDFVLLMKTRGLEAYAVQDPKAPGRFVAAMLVPDVQLLVVSAKSTSPDYVQNQIAQHQYREVYSTLSSTAVQDTELFFQDMGCDGLARDGETIDIMYERGTVQTIFDGDWKKHNMSKSAYEDKFQNADTEYGEALALLTASLRTTTP